MIVDYAINIAMEENKELTIEERVSKFFRKKGITEEAIKYILHEDGKTNIYLSDGRKISTYTSAGDIMTILQIGNYFHVNRGMYLAIKEVAHINDNIYTMLDGKKIIGRAYQMDDHEANKKILLNNYKGSQDTISISDRFSGFDNCPLAVCVMEVLTDNSHNVEFIIRYCNDRMALLDGLSKNKIIGNSVYDIYEEGDKLRLATFADVASTGRTHIVERVSPLTNKKVRIQCFQPAYGFCACIEL